MSRRGGGTLRPVDNDGWGGAFRREANTRYRYTVEA
jgi:hypothetical protein